MEYNGLVANIIFNLCMMFLWFAFLWRVLDGRRFSVWLTILLAVLINCAYTFPILFFTKVGSLTRTLLTPTGPLAMAFVLFYGKPMRKILAVGLELAASFLLEIMFLPMLINFKSDDMISIWIDPNTVAYGAVFLPVLGLVLFLFSLPMTRSRNNLSAKQTVAFAALPFSQAISTVVLSTLMANPPRYEYTPLLVVISVVFIASDIVLYRMMMKTEQRVQLEVENALLEKQLDAQLAHYTDLTHQYEQIRAMRHDIYHHLNTINILLQDGNMQAATEYSEQLMPAQKFISRLGECQNPTVDAFLYSRIREADKQGISVQVDVALPAELAIENTDLIVLFGNLMDNAIEACKQTENAALSLAAHISRGYLIVRESNPTPEHPAAKSRRIPQLERGVGFRVLNGLAEKYSGSFTHAVENGVYTATVILKA